MAMQSLSELEKVKNKAHEATMILYQVEYLAALAMQCANEGMKVEDYTLFQSIQSLADSGLKSLGERSLEV